MIVVRMGQEECSDLLRLNAGFFQFPLKPAESVLISCINQDITIISRDQPVIDHTVPQITDFHRAASNNNQVRRNRT